MSEEKMKFSLALREAIRNLPRYGFDGDLGGDFGAQAAGPYIRRQDAMAVLVDLGARGDALERLHAAVVEHRAMFEGTGDELNMTAVSVVAALDALGAPAPAEPRTGDATIVASVLAAGYEGGFLGTTPADQSVTLQLRYSSPAAAEAGFEELARGIDAALAAAAPNDVATITTGIDVAENRIEVAVTAWADGAAHNDTDVAAASRAVVGDAIPAYEALFREQVTDLAMRHIDRMNDIDDGDPAERIIKSFTAQFDPIFEAYMTSKFPGRAPGSAVRRPAPGALTAEQVAAARIALDDLDDFAKMDVSVDPAGARGVLERFIDLVSAGRVPARHLPGGAALREQWERVDVEIGGAAMHAAAFDDGVNCAEVVAQAAGAPTVSISGELRVIGGMDDGNQGIQLYREGGAALTITGLSAEEVRAVGMKHLMDVVQVDLGAPAPGASS